MVWNLNGIWDQSYKINFGINYIKNRLNKLKFALNYINFDVIYTKKFYRIDPWNPEAQPFEIQANVIILQILWLKSMQKVVLASKNLFQPANGVRSTSSLVDIHNISAHSF